MDTCPSCGATLSPDLSWCGRCYVPIHRALDEDEPPMWIRTQRREPVSFEGARLSRWRAGPTSFGALGRAVLSVLVLLGAVAGYPLARGGMIASIGIDIPGAPFLVGYVVVAGGGALYLLLRIWKRARIA